jgi:acyl-CoA synthetase (AMP-forming)/AMP-acid ligase II
MAMLNGERFADDVAVIDGDSVLTFADVRAGMLAVGRALMARGVTPGDRVALWAPNSAAWITTALGIQAAGAWLVPLNTRFKGNEAAYVLRRTGARAVLAANGFLGVDYLDMLRGADPSVPALAGAVTMGDDSAGATPWDAFLAGGHDVLESAALARIEAIRSEDVSDVMFTSGTTGHPKGAMLRHGTSMRCYGDLYNEGFQLGRGDRMLIVTPFFHCFGYKAGWMLALMVGATSVPLAVFDAGQALRLIEGVGITHTSGAPSMFWSLLDHPDRTRRDLSSLRVTLAAAAYVPVELVERVRKDLGVSGVMSGYGLTEAHALVSYSHRGDPPDVVAAWSGQVVEGTEYRIVDDDGNDVPLGERGELLVRGFQLMSGYYGDPEATAAVIDRDGWLHTGDIAYANADDYIKVCDRKKDMFIVNGFNVAPAEVEGVLVDWDAVAAAAVVGVPDARRGEVGVAFVVPAVGTHLTEAEVVAYARERMANYKVPDRVELVDALPVNATGKVLKVELRARLEAERHPTRTTEASDESP